MTIKDKKSVLLTSCWSGRQAIDSSGVSWSELHWKGLLPPRGTFSCQYCLNKTQELIGFEKVSLYRFNMYLYYEFCSQFTLIYFNLLAFTLNVFLVDFHRFSKSSFVSSSFICICVLNCRRRLIFDLPELWCAFKLGLRPTPICDYCQHLIEMSPVYQMIDLVLRVIMETETERGKWIEEQKIL